MKKIIVSLAILTFLIASPTSAALTKDLKYGMVADAEVTELQEFLTSEGLYSGPITGNFYSLTLKSVKAFQSRESITPVSGYVGTKTRAKLNTILEDAVTEDEITQPKATSTAVDAIQAQLNLLLQQLQALQSQGQAQQQTNQELQQLNQNVQGQQNTLNQIVSNTTSTPPSQPIPPPTPAPIVKKFVIAFRENDNNGYRATNNLSVTYDVTQSIDIASPLRFAVLLKEGDEYIGSPNVFDVQVSTTDSTQNVLTGSNNYTNGIYLSNLGGYKFTGKHVGYAYFPKTTGEHVITFHSPSLNLTESVTINVISP